jgi:tRNA-2-methylthio-N6-dimethylallyladenosine synthase
MNRGYSAGQYMEFIDRARQHMPDVCIASDFIVGFPTETEEEFTQTAELLRRCRFKNSFIFKYSPRPGTTAMDRFADDIPEPVKRRRNNDLLAVQQEICGQENAKMVGKTVEVLVEGQSKLISRREEKTNVELKWTKKPADSHPQELTQLVGRTRGDQVVVFDGPITLKGQMLNVDIIDSRSLTLFGRRHATH